MSEGRKFASEEINPGDLCTSPVHLVSWWQVTPSKKVRLSLLTVQDVDAAYISKVNLQSKVDVLSGEVNFLKHLFEMVSSVLMRNPCLFSYLTRSMGCKRGEA